MKRWLGPGENARRWTPIIIFVSVPVILFLLFHRAIFFEAWSDENIHLYVAGRVSEGLSLYGDIHSARPPLSIAPLTLLDFLGVPPLAAARGTVIAAELATAAVLAWVGFRLWGREAAILAIYLYLLSPAVMGRHTWTGIGAVSFLCTSCAALAFRKKPLLSGLAGGMALCSGQHAAVIVGLSSGVAALHGRKEFFRFLAGCGGVIAFTVAAVLSAGGRDIFADLVGHHLYHFQQGSHAKDTDFAGWFAVWTSDNVPILLMALFALIHDTFASPEDFLSSGKWREPSFMLAVMAVTHMAVVAFMAGGHVLYLHPAFPLVALLAGRGAVIVTRRLCELPRSSTQRPFAVMLIVAVLAATAAGWGTSMLMFEKKDGIEYPYIPYARLFKMAKIQRPVVADKILAAIRPAMPAGGTIFGHPTIAALLAVKMDVRIAGELADLDPAWLRAGYVDKMVLIESIERDGVEFFVTPAWFFVRDPLFSRYLGRCYDTPMEFSRLKGSGIPRILVFRRADVPRPCLPPGGAARPF